MTYQYVSDQKGKTKAVIIPIRDFKKIKEDLDEFEAIKEYDKTKAENLPFRPLKDALKDIEVKRAKKK
jgi:hypothetical protein